MRNLRFLVPTALLLFTAGTLHANEAAPSKAIADFESFVTGTVTACQHQPAQSCVDKGWLYTDTDTNGAITATEIQAVRAAMGDWFAWRQASLTKQERSALALGMLVADSVGLGKLLDGFDSNGDGQVTQQELLADVTMDQRPLGEILSDRESVDREAVAQRLGAAAPFLNGMLR